MKAGTTSLHSYLASHPDVFMSDPKELEFFPDSRNWSRGVGWYRSKFAGGADAVARGEASTIYAMYPLIPHVPQRIAELVPDVRLVYVVREPIERMRSQWRQNTVYAGERRPVDEALLNDPHYLACSRYAFQLDQYLDHFPREQILVITSEALRDDRAETVAHVLRFIGIDDVGVDGAVLGREVHASTATRARTRAGRIVRRVPGHDVIARAVPKQVLGVWHRATSRELDRDAMDIAPETRARLADALVDDIQRLRPWLGESFDGWGLG